MILRFSVLHLIFAAALDAENLINLHLDKLSLDFFPLLNPNLKKKN